MTQNNALARGAPPTATDEGLIHPVGGVKSNDEKRIQVC